MLRLVRFLTCGIAIIYQLTGSAFFEAVATLSAGGALIWCWRVNVARNTCLCNSEQFQRGAVMILIAIGCRQDVIIPSNAWSSNSYAVPFDRMWWYPAIWLRSNSNSSYWKAERCRCKTQVANECHQTWRDGCMVLVAACNLIDRVAGCGSWYYSCSCRCNVVGWWHLVLAGR